MTTFAKHYPMRVITELLGIPREDEDRMAAWAKAMLNSVIDPRGTERANAEFTEYVAPLVANGGPIRATTSSPPSSTRR